MIHYPKSLDIIFQKLLKNDIKAIIVGGYVRDTLLSIESKDIDIELYGVNSQDKLETILSEFGSVNSVGKSFGVIKLKYQNMELDFSLPREDNKVANGHKGFNVTTHSSLDFKTAAKRRDFTINAIGYDVNKKKILDPFHGIDDLKDKILRAVDSKTFQEDPLRILRGVGFSARFKFSFSKELFLLCKSMINNSLLEELSQERVFEEIKKLLLKSKNPSIGFKLLGDLEALKYFSHLGTLQQEEFSEMLLTLDTMNKTKITYMLAALCYKFSENETIEFIHSLSSDKKLLKDLLSITKNYKQIELVYKNKMKKYDIYKLATYANIQELLYLNEAIYYSQNKNSKYRIGEEIRKKAKDLGVLDKKIPEILQGKDLIMLGLQPSPIFSKILDEAYELQMHSKFTTHKDAIKWLKKNYTNFSS